ncbi:helix-turn-helix domain-containing protein [Fontibacillus phaseoli]|uniref:helix-turn-helix domain-containing protein n=1 Tax=Fontibacillus phaseoli TaxID=1416533 RepID=UPI0015F0FFE5|nr:helix-turn-helix domain-containing protein [Fontibacillus phaseoli]
MRDRAVKGLSVKRVHSEITLDRLAEVTHLSKYYGSRIFGQETGYSITDYLQVRRVKHACRLLKTTELSVQQIGALSSFEVRPISSIFSSGS